MSIIDPLPFTIANGTTGDASQVQANFDQIVSDVNSKAAGGGGAGNVVGPNSAVDGDVALFNGTTGKILKDGGAPALMGLLKSVKHTSQTMNGSSVTLPARSIPLFVIFESTAGLGTSANMKLTPSGGSAQDTSVAAAASDGIATAMVGPGYGGANQYFSASPISVAITCASWNSTTVNTTLYYVTI